MSYMHAWMHDAACKMLGLINFHCVILLKYMHRCIYTNTCLYKQFLHTHTHTWSTLHRQIHTTASLRDKTIDWPSMNWSSVYVYIYIYITTRFPPPSAHRPKVEINDICYKVCVQKCSLEQFLETSECHHWKQASSYAHSFQELFRVGLRGFRKLSRLGWLKWCTQSHIR